METRIAADWRLTLLDAAPDNNGMGSLAVGDIDGDGNDEIAIGGDEALLWYRPSTREKGTIAEGRFAVGIQIADVDGDGRSEVVTSEHIDGKGWCVVWYHHEGDLAGPWQRHVIAEQCNGSAHDLLFCDIDGDGEDELVANAAYCETWGCYVYKRGTDPAAPWQRTVVQEGHAEEGLSVGDITGDSALEIVSGTSWYRRPAEGPLTGPWERHNYAACFREMVRVACVDITGDGRADIVITDSEYVDGRMSWYENRATEGAIEMIEHPMDSGLVFSHSLEARRDDATGTVTVFVAEMAAGGWGQPYNHDARVMQYTTSDGGATWVRNILYTGSGTHQAVMHDIDHDGELEVVGKVWANPLLIPRVQIYTRSDTPSPTAGLRHRFIDRDKPCTGTDIFAADISGDDTQDIVCGRWWYRLSDNARFEIPGIYQAICAYDIDGDGRDELVATLPRSTDEDGWYSKLSCDLVWVKAVDPVAGTWQQHPIGTGTGDWPHGNLIGPFGPDGSPALITGYHNARSGPVSPDIWEISGDPSTGPWSRKTLADIPYGEEFSAADIDGDGALEIIAGPFVLEPSGDGSFRVHTIVPDFEPARQCLLDITGNGLPDIVYGEELLDYPNKHVPYGRVLWAENPGTLDGTPWRVHVIDKVRCPHSLCAVDIDSDGTCEVLCGEHDPFKPYRSRCRLFVYRQADDNGIAWNRFVLDDRFEHHDGVQPVQLTGGRTGIVSHGWAEERYVHLWEPA